LSNKVNLNAYNDFVKEVTSNESQDSVAMYERIIDIEKTSGVNMASLLTGSIGMASEGGEFSEIVKKCVFQGKPMDDATIFHAKRELGDIIWYWITACRALNLDPNEVIEENVNRLISGN
jgi:hypothetical protein